MSHEDELSFASDLLVHVPNEKRHVPDRRDDHDSAKIVAQLSNSRNCVNVVHNDGRRVIGILQEDVKVEDVPKEIVDENADASERSGRPMIQEDPT